MSFDITIPELSNKSLSKDLILGLLVKDWPLTLKGIHARIKKEFMYKGSYQSVFKSVNELLAKKVLVKKGREYEINISWIKELQSWTNSVETNYYSEKKTKEDIGMKSEGVVVLNFNSIFDAEKYLYYFIKNELKKTRNRKVVYEMNNLWKVLFYYRAEYNYYRKLMKLGHKFYFFHSGDSAIEQKARIFYKRIGVSVKKRQSSPMDSIIFQDYYIQFFISDKLKSKISKFLEEGKEFELLKVLDEYEDSIKIIIHRDKSLANGLLKKYL